MNPLTATRRGEAPISAFLPGGQYARTLPAGRVHNSVVPTARRLGQSADAASRPRSPAQLRREDKVPC